MNDSLRVMLAMMELEIRRLTHDRTEVYTRAIQPVLWLAVFGTVFSAVHAIPTNGIPYLDYITPGVLLQSVIFVAVFYGLMLVWERETGILKKLLVAPASRYATVIGRATAAGVRAIVQVVVVIPIALLLGVRFVPNPAYFITALVILFIIAGGFAALSIIVAALMKTRERFMGIGQALILPLFFASNAPYPISLMPRALQLFAIINPLTYAVDAVRGLMITGDVALLPLDVAVIALFDALVFALASLSFRKIIE
ncbi:MAG: ABC transporter permease [Halobacteriota archaeon]